MSSQKKGKSDVGRGQDRRETTRDADSKDTVPNPESREADHDPTVIAPKSDTQTEPAGGTKAATSSTGRDVGGTPTDGDQRKASETSAPLNTSSPNETANDQSPGAPAAEQTVIVGGGVMEVDPSDPQSREHPGISIAGRRPGAEGSATLSSYELIEDFAHGGMGKIWRARDVRIRREVAFKELLPRALGQPGLIERFLEEAQITGQLEHPGIVPVYDLGRQDDGLPYYAMKLVRGITLKEAIKQYHRLPLNTNERRLAFVKLLRNFVDICNAVAFAHNRGVLHRDLKPQNVMLGDFGETLVLDWGLAKLLDAGETKWAAEHAADDPDATLHRKDASGTQVSGSDAPASGATSPDTSQPESIQSETAQTETAQTQGRKRTLVTTDARTAGSHTAAGSVLGTAAYMPPEQAQGRLSELDERADIYSLGAILYEILAGQSPVPRLPVVEMIKYVIKGTLISPRHHDPTVPKPLEAVCMKALSKSREARYASARDLAADVEAYLADEPVAAYPEPWYQAARRWAKRHKTVVAATAATLAAVAMGLIIWSRIEGRRIDGIRGQVEKQLAQAQAAVDADEFEKSKLHLSRATGLVGAETSLAELGRTVRALEAVRIAKLRATAEQSLSVVKDAISREQYDRAADSLTRLDAQLRDEPELADLTATAQEHRRTIGLALAANQARTAAREQYAHFSREVDEARFHGSLLTGDNLDEQLRQAKTHAQTAVALYQLDQPAPLKDSPAHLTDEQIESIRNDSYEMMLILAEAETTLARHAGDEQQESAASAALQWIEQAARLGIETRVRLLRKANYLERLGRTDERDMARAAAESCTPVTALDHFLLAEEARKRNRIDEALVLYQSALNLDPDHFWSLYFTGLCHLRRPDPAAALSSYTACIARRPQFHATYLTRAIAFSALGQHDEALADFQRAIERKPDEPGIYLNRGAVYLEQKQYDAAVADFQHAARLRPDLAGPWINLAEAYRRMESFQQSLASLAKAGELDAYNPEIHRIRGDVNSRLGAFDESRRDLLRSIELDGDPLRTASSYKEIGLIHHRLGEMERALNAYDSSLAASREDPDVDRLRAEVLLDLGRNVEAVDSYSNYIEKAEPVGDVYRARGLTRASLGRYHEAMTDYTRSLELEPSANILTRRGWAYVLQGYQLALKDFDEAIRLNPNNADSYNGRGYARVMLGDYAGATADAESAIKLADREIARRGRIAWPLIYNAATIYAQAVERVQRDHELSEEQRKETAGGHARRAVELIRKAKSVAGDEQRQTVSRTIDTDTALDPIRDRSEFQEAFPSN